MAQPSLSISSATSNGLEGISVARTVLSHVDGEKGKLVVCGYDIENFAGHVSFEQACGLLWQGKLPEPSETANVRRRLGMARGRIFAEMAKVEEAMKLENGMNALRAALGLLEPSRFPEIS